MSSLFHLVRQLLGAAVLIALGCFMSMVFDSDAFAFTFCFLASVAYVAWLEYLEFPRKINFTEFQASSGKVKENLRRAHIPEYSIRGLGSKFRDINLRNVDLRGANLRKADLKKANLKLINLQGTNLKNANLERADLRGAILGDITQGGGGLGGALASVNKNIPQISNLRGINLKGADLSIYTAEVGSPPRRIGTKTFLGGADLQRADLRKANLKGANFRGASLKGADFRDADLSSYIFFDGPVSIFGESVNHTVSEDTNLEKADLRKADLRRANLRGAILCDADLRRANLRGAILCDADLRRANLRGAILCDADLKGVKWDQQTKWPPYQEVTRAVNVPEVLKKRIGIL